MGVGISYMGTKRDLALTVSDVIATCSPGPILDVFSGMCSVGETVAPARQIWTNDVQLFAFEVAQALFTSHTYPLRSHVIADRYYEKFSTTLQKLSLHYEAAIEIEKASLQALDFDEFQNERQRLAETLNYCRQNHCSEQYHLFSKQYSDSFFGVQQSLEIDAIIATIKALDGSATKSDCARWLTIALGRCMLRVSNSTGHFAQYLQPKQRNYHKFQRQRRRRIWQEWLESNDDLEPVGNVHWRKKIERLIRIRSYYYRIYLTATISRQ